MSTNALGWQNYKLAPSEDGMPTVEEAKDSFTSKKGYERYFSTPDQRYKDRQTISEISSVARRGDGYSTKRQKDEADEQNDGETLYWANVDAVTSRIPYGGTAISANAFFNGKGIPLFKVTAGDTGLNSISGYSANIKYIQFNPMFWRYRSSTTVWTAPHLKGRLLIVQMNSTGQLTWTNNFNVSSPSVIPREYVLDMGTSGTFTDPTVAAINPNNCKDFTVLFDKPYILNTYAALPTSASAYYPICMDTIFIPGKSWDKAKDLIRVQYSSNAITTAINPEKGQVVAYFFTNAAQIATTADFATVEAIVTFNSLIEVAD